MLHEQGLAFKQQNIFHIWFYKLIDEDIDGNLSAEYNEGIFLFSKSII